jgi:hypothetical protein
LSNRIAVAVSFAALAVVVLVETPLGESASRVVPIARFAKNAGMVNGIRASRTPRSGQLVPLTSAGKFPSGLVPTSQGPAGPQGPAGGLGRVVQWTVAARSGPAKITLYGEKAWALTVRAFVSAPPPGPREMGCTLAAGSDEAPSVIDQSTVTVHSYDTTEIVLLGVARASSATNRATTVVVNCPNGLSLGQGLVRIIAVPASDIDVNS